MQTWVIFTIIYAICNGIYNCSKKKATEKNNIFTILAVFTTISFVIVALFTQDAFDVSITKIPVILAKAVVIALSWILNMYAIKKMSLSLYGILNIFSIIFVEALSVIFLKESLSIRIVVGMLIIIVALVLVNCISNKDKKRESTPLAIFFTITACLFSSISAIIDKKVLSEITSTQLQFWFLAFLAIIFWLVWLFKSRKFEFVELRKNYWVLIMAVIIALGDRFLFMANADSNSKASIIKLINQLSTIEIIILGKILFKEKNIIKKLLCSLLIIVGVAVIVI